jgi:hypothetical protein
MHLIHRMILAVIEARCRPGRTRYEMRTTAMPVRVGTITSAP